MCIRTPEDIFDHINYNSCTKLINTGGEKEETTQRSILFTAKFRLVL